MPDWVPVIGGKKFGFNIPKIPKLAKGTVVDKPTPAVFGEDGAVTMVQGGGNAEGTYEYSDDNTAIKMTLDFGGTEVTYAGFLSEVGDTVTLIAMSDMNGYDGLYFVQ